MLLLTPSPRGRRTGVMPDLIGHPDIWIPAFAGMTKSLSLWERAVKEK